jgi:hypothetical protein
MPYETTHVISGLGLTIKPEGKALPNRSKAATGPKVGKHHRHEHLKSRVLPHLRNAGLSGDSLFHAAWESVKSSCELTSDFSEAEVRELCEWFDNKESLSDLPSKGDRGRAPNKFQILLELLENADVKYFHDQFQKGWACIQHTGHYENLPIKSKRFRTYLTKLFYEATQGGCGRETIQQVQELCTAKALFNGSQTPLSCRAAWVGDKILIDMGTTDWRAIEVSPDGWTITHPKHPPFRRFSHMKPLPEPKPGGSVLEILSILPIKDEASQVLVCVWLPSILVPDLPRPGLVLSGLQGSGKTFTTERLRQLIDPSQTLTLSLAKDATELIQAIDHHYLPAFDNLDSLPKWASDVLCRAVTGAGFTKRELFSDDDDFTYSFFRPFILNGISVCASRPDLLDRSLIIELDRISKTERRSLRSLGGKFRELQPNILHAMLDALVEAMRQKDRRTLPELPRLADWCEWAVPIAESIGYGQDRFLEALNQNIDRQHSEVTNSDPAAVALLHFMSAQSEWAGTPTQLYHELSGVAATLKLDREKSWPKAPNALTRKLKAISHNLVAEGVEVRESKGGHKGTRQTIISKVVQEPAPPPDTPSAPSNRQQDNYINRLSAGDSAGDIDSRDRNNTDRQKQEDKYQASLPFDDADDADDISGNFVVCDSKTGEPLEEAPF